MRQASMSMQHMLRGSDIEACRIYFSMVGARLKILDALRSLPEFEPDDGPSEDNLPESDSFVWLRRGESKRIEASISDSFVWLRRGESKRIEASMPEAFRHSD